ncbi:hypothetical protein QL285_091334 [Trifolium repens]|nr:hypothetical protein QL285_091334 [Trifolium repens]
MVCWVDNQWRRELQWRHNFFEREEALNLQLLQLLNSFQPSEQEDFWQRREFKLRTTCGKGGCYKSSRSIVFFAV